MDSEPVRRPRVARETRLLITVALLAVVALWALARLRFPESTPAQQVVAPILAPLVARQGFAGLENQLSEVSARLGSSLSLFRTAAPDQAGPAGARHVAALRLHDDVAVVLPGLAETVVLDGTTSVGARDDVTGLTVLRIAPGPAAPLTPSWFQRDPASPRYIVQTSASEAGTALVPVLVAGLAPVDAPLWSGTVWRANPADDLTPGAFLFTPEGEWIGLVVTHGDAPAIAPADLVSRLAEFRLQHAGGSPMHLGVEVQAMTPALRDLLGFQTGVVVSWVAPDGPAREALQIGDVLHAADGHALPTMDHWQRHVADLGARPTVLRVWRGGQSTDATVSPVALAAPLDTATSDPLRRELGVTARHVPGVGSEITAIQPDSLATAAALRVGDVITQVGTIAAPTPAQFRAAASVVRTGRSLLVAVARRGSHHLTVIAP